MNIHGFYKLTLLDYPKHLACSIFTGGCNFRCPFCHNASLVTHVSPKTELREQDILDFLQTRVGILDGVCITGGEPSLQTDLKVFMTKIKEMGYLIKLDTNGTQPQIIQSLIQNNLVDYIAMDIKNSAQKYAITVDVPSFDFSPIKQSIDLIMESSIEYEFRTTVIKEYHEKEDFYGIAELIANCSQYFLQSFVDSGDLIHTGVSGYSTEEMKSLCSFVRPLIPNTQIRGIE